MPPAILLSVLRRRERWVEALEVAAAHLSERGLYRRLYQLLEPLAGDDTVLTWQLRAAKRLGRVEELRERIEAALREREAPDLRAIYATTQRGALSLREAERAYRAAKTLTTLQHYGLSLSYVDPKGAFAVIRELLELFGERGHPSTLKSALSKLRQRLPISRPPYRLELPFQADFLELEGLLREGRVRAGLELYKGPLLPRSEAPGVVRERETLEESLRQAVLTSGDPEALLGLAERLGDDLELWEAAIDALPRQDPRYALSSARHKKVLDSW